MATKTQDTFNILRYCLSKERHATETEWKIFQLCGMLFWEGTAYFTSNETEENHV